MLSDAELDRYWNIAVRDDWHRELVGSDIRILIREIQRLRGVAQAARSLSDYTNAEISNEWHRRAMDFLGDQRVGVTLPSTNRVEGHCWCGLHVDCRDQCDRCNERGVFARPQPGAVAGTDPLAGLDERLDRLLLTANDNSRFVLSTESAKNIVGIVREWLRVKGYPVSSTDRAAPPSVALEASETVAIRRSWLEDVIKTLQGPLPSGHIGDVVFLLRDQLQDALTRPQPGGAVAGTERGTP